MKVGRGINDVHHSKLLKFVFREFDKNLAATNVYWIFYIERGCTSARFKRPSIKAGVLIDLEVVTSCGFVKLSKASLTRHRFRSIWDWPSVYVRTLRCVLQWFQCSLFASTAHSFQHWEAPRLGSEAPYYVDSGFDRLRDIGLV